MRHLTLFLGTFFLLQAGIINGIAMVVDGTPVTLMEIEKLSAQAGISQSQAQYELAKQALTVRLAKEHQVDISESEIDLYIDGIMRQNNLTKEQLKQQLKLQGTTYPKFVEQIKNQQLYQRLVQALTYSKLSTPTDEEKRAFFAQNSADFATPQSIDVIEYHSPNQASLQSIAKSPLFAPADVTQEHKTLTLNSINPQLAQLLLSTPVSSYTAVLPLGAQTYGMFYIAQLGAVETPNYETIEPKLEAIMQNKQRNMIMKTLFEDALRKANIDYLRVEPLQF
ncbi:MAG: hypothetical protein KU37_05815 [Sulfuricurvum sp. PC08-66]|nr:MAG: hypothetical protein KU37_05815 [Sulfuricurvum sp. PC08-66]